MAGEGGGWGFGGEGEDWVRPGGNEFGRDGAASRPVACTAAIFNADCGAVGPLPGSSGPFLTMIGAVYHCPPVCKHREAGDSSGIRRPRGARVARLAARGGGVRGSRGRFPRRRGPTRASAPLSVHAGRTVRDAASVGGGGWANRRLFWCRFHGHSCAFGDGGSFEVRLRIRWHMIAPNGRGTSRPPIM